MQTRMIIMSSWAFVLVLLGLCAPAHSQLGEAKAAGRSWDEPPVSEPEDYYDKVDYDNDYEVSEKEDRQRSAVIPKPTSWRPVLDTYQGCLSDGHILNGTFHFVNLTQHDQEILDAENKAEACFNLCLKQDPFSFFVSLNLGLEGDNDVCGCLPKDDVELQYTLSDDSGCDTNATLSRIYCGPENSGCINTSPDVRTPSFLCLVISAFVTSFIVTR